MEHYNMQKSSNKQMQEPLDGIMKAVQGEREDELFYDYLISQAPNDDEKQIIGAIRDDERRHNMLFRRMYKDFTGMEVPKNEEEEFQKPESYLAGIKKALFGELSAVERYRAIRRRLPIGIYRDMLFDIITDELKHASKYNYLFTINSIKNNSSTNNSTINKTKMGSKSMENEPGANEGSMNSSSMEEDMMDNSNKNRSRAMEDTSKFTPDEWIKYIEPLVNNFAEEAKGEINPDYLHQKYILAGVLVGLGKKPQEAIEQVEMWESEGNSKLLSMGKMSRYFDF